VLHVIGEVVTECGKEAARRFGALFTNRGRWSLRLVWRRRVDWLGGVLRTRDKWEQHDKRCSEH
jgi:hypothetical protein